MNTLKTTFLMALLTVLLITACGLMGGQGGMIMAFLFALIMNGIGYWFSDKIVLRMYGGQAVTAGKAPKLYRNVQELALRAQTPLPKVYLIPQEAPNAFATGRDEKHAAVAVTDPRSLMLAVLEDAIACIQAGLTKPCPRKEKLLMETREWVHANDDSVFSFTNFCKTIGFDPRALRSELRSWEARLIDARSKEKNQPIVKKAKFTGNKKSAANRSSLSLNIYGRTVQKASRKESLWNRID